MAETTQRWRSLRRRDFATSKRMMVLWMAVADPASFGIEYYYSMEPVSVLFLSAGGAGRQRPSSIVRINPTTPLFYFS